MVSCTAINLAAVGPCYTPSGGQFASGARHAATVLHSEQWATVHDPFCSFSCPFCFDAVLSSRASTSVAVRTAEPRRGDRSVSVVPATCAVLAAIMLCSSCPTTSRAAGGWYLLAPPFDDFESSRKTGGPRVLDDAPLDKWSRISSFDSAQACEQSRQEVIRFLTREDQNPTFSRGGAMLNRDRAVLSKCVPSDDPRLK